MKINRENGKWLLITEEKVIATETFKECWAALIQECTIILAECGAILTEDRKYILIPGEGLIRVESYIRRLYAESNQ